MDKIDEGLLAEIVSNLKANGKPVTDAVIMRGEFPDCGKDAEIKFNCELIDHKDGSKKGKDIIEKGGLIAAKIPPYAGYKAGKNVRGDIIPSPPARDIEIIAGQNVVISDDGNEVYTADEGTPKVIIKEHTTPEYKEKVTISLSVAQTVDGGKPVNLTIDEPLTVKGTLKKGSKITSRNLVVIEGNIEPGAIIQTSGDIHISGNVLGSTLSSSGMIDHVKDVSDSKLVAEGKITISGIVRNSTIVGEEVIVERIQGSTITASKSIVVNHIDQNHDGFAGFLQVGEKGQKKELIKENNVFIDFAKNNLNTFSKVFGQSIVEKVSEANMSQMMMIHMSNMQKRGVVLGEAQKNTMQALMNAVAPIRKLMREKQSNNARYSTIEGSNNPEELSITVKVPVNFPVKIEVEGAVDHIRPEDGVVEARYEEGKIVKTAKSA